MVRSRPAAREAATSTRATSWDLVPDERIGPLTHPGRLRRSISVGLVGLVAACGGWAWFDPPGFSAAARQAGEVVTRLAADAWDKLPTTRREGQQSPQAAAGGAGSGTHGADRALAPLPEIEPAAPSSTRPGADAASAGTAYATPEAPPVSSVETGLRRRAEAAGLHPDLSLALLERLSNNDFKNAALAIEMALRELEDNAVLVWPRQRAPNEALYVIHFVTGAGPNCRRYVVAIDKDRWSTTAQPVERCGVARRETGK